MIKFPYIPISYAIADVRSEFKKRDRTGQIDENDCINWAIEVIRAIGGSGYDTKGVVAHVKDHVYTMPPDFYKIDEVFLVKRADRHYGNIGRIWFTEEGSFDYCGTTLVFPGDSFTGQKYCAASTVSTNSRVTSYIMRHPNQLRYSDATGTLGIQYLFLPMTPEGQPLMQDEVNTLKAIKAFIKLKLLEEEFVDQKTPQYIYMKLEKDYDDAVSEAQSIFKFNDPADDGARAYIQDHRYDAFKF